MERYVCYPLNQITFDDDFSVSAMERCVCYPLNQITFDDEFSVSVNGEICLLSLKSDNFR